MSTATPTPPSPDSHAARTIRVATVAELKSKGVIVVHGSDRPIAVFYNDGEIAAVDNRCPHMGFPMHKGTVRDGMVTCHWHEARFDLCSGCTFDLFADDLPAFDAVVRDDVVYVEAQPRHTAGRDYYYQRLRRGLEQNISLIQGKGLIGLLKSGVALDDIIRFVADFGCHNHDDWQSGMTSLTIVANLAPHLSEETLYAALFRGVSRVASDCANVAPRRNRHALETDRHDLSRLKSWLRHWTLVRHRDGAERTLMTAVAQSASPAEVTDLLATAASDRPYAASGHQFDFCNKAMELLEHIGNEHAAIVLPLLLGGVVRARGGEEDSSWRYPIDLIPPLRELEAKLPELMQHDVDEQWGDGDAATALDGALLGDDPLAIFDALQHALSSGAAPLELSRRVCHAAALRLARFAPSNDVRDWFGPIHTFTYCNAAHRSLERSPTPDVLRATLHGAIAVYLDRFLNVPPAKLPGERRGLDDLPTGRDELLDMLLTSLDQKHEPDRAARIVARYLAQQHETQPLIDRLTFAVVREDLDFHAMQLLEAAVQQQQLWPRQSAQVMHLFVAVARYLAAHCPTQRAGLQTSQIALRLHRGDAIYEEDDG